MSRGPIAAHVAAVNAALRGPRRSRADLLAELRDGLEDTAAAYVDSGLSPMEAERRAVAESGSVAELAPSYQAELANGQGIRTAMLLTLSLPANYLAWNLLWRSDNSGNWAPAGFYQFLSEVTDLAGLVGGGVALVALLGLLWCARTGRDAGRLVRGLAVTEASLLLLMVVAAVGMNVVEVGQTTDAVRTVGTPVAIVGVLTVLALVAQTRALWRTFTVCARPALA